MTLGSHLVINNTESRYLIRMKREGVIFKDPIMVGAQFQNNKIILMSKAIGAVPEDALLTIGEEIKSVNGKTAADFADECEFIRWSATGKPEAIHLTKMDGTNLVFKPVKLK